MSDEVGHLSFWAVHDSFGTHARDIERLRGVVLGAFKEMHLGCDLNLWLREMRETGGPKLRIGKKKHERFENEWGESTFLIG
jgi:DNA-directed RNA polymerase